MKIQCGSDAIALLKDVLGIEQKHIKRLRIDVSFDSVAEVTIDTFGKDVSCVSSEKVDTIDNDTTKYEVTVRKIVDDLSIN